MVFFLHTLGGLFKNDTLTRLVFPRDPDPTYYYQSHGPCENLNDADHHTLFRSSNVPRGLKDLKIVTINFNLGDLAEYVGEFTQSVTIHADRVTNSLSRPLLLNVNFSLTVVARTAHINEDIGIEVLFKDVIKNKWSITYEIKYARIGNVVLRKRFIGPITIIDTKPMTKALRASDVACAPTVLPSIDEVLEHQFYVIYDSNFMNLIFICLTMIQSEYGMQSMFDGMLNFLYEIVNGVEFTQREDEQGLAVTRIKTYIDQSGMFEKPKITPIPYNSKQDLLLMLEKNIEFIENYYTNEVKFQTEMIKEEARSSAEIQEYIRELRDRVVFRKKIGDIIADFKKENVKNFKEKFISLMQSSLELVSKTTEAVFETQARVAKTNKQISLIRAQTQVAKTQSVMTAVGKVSDLKFQEMKSKVSAIVSSQSHMGTGFFFRGFGPPEIGLRKGQFCPWAFGPRAELAFSSGPIFPMMPAPGVYH